ncbi:hypothetical protein [Synechococcus sp. PCC 7336]|uniref:hypothetical protein n=1 Tax=Synechococcus sp. PCC 7336 TaxID=195250 RepID=UPI00035FB021|nr:hypothetical protein [Synechococcus sp. PCC 7336]
MSTIFVVCGKVNYTNLSRYSELSERTYRRHFEQGLGLERLNQTLIEQVSSSQSNQIAVVDCNFVEKVVVIPPDWIGFITAKPNEPSEVWSGR